MDPDAVAKAFVEHYYSTFDANRAGLANLYQDGSMLTFEGQKIQGSQNIVAKLTSLPFQQCKHQITTVDCQPSGPAGGMLVFVSGNLQLAGEQHALKFSQVSNSQSNLFRPDCVLQVFLDIFETVCVLSWFWIIIEFWIMIEFPISYSYKSLFGCFPFLWDRRSVTEWVNGDKNVQIYLNARATFVVANLKLTKWSLPILNSQFTLNFQELK